MKYLLLVTLCLSFFVAPSSAELEAIGWIAGTTGRRWFSFSRLNRIRNDRGLKFTPFAEKGRSMSPHMFFYDARVTRDLHNHFPTNIQKRAVALYLDESMDPIFNDLITRVTVPALKSVSTDRERRKIIARLVRVALPYKPASKRIHPSFFIGDHLKARSGDRVTRAALREYLGQMTGVKRRSVWGRQLEPAPFRRLVHSGLRDETNL